MDTSVEPILWSDRSFDNGCDRQKIIMTTMTDFDDDTASLVIVGALSPVNH